MGIIKSAFMQHVLAAFAFAAATYIVSKYVVGLISPFLFAYLVSLMVEPLVRFLEHRGMSRGFSALISMACFTLVVAFIGSAIIGNIWKEAVLFTTQIPLFLSELQSMVDGFVHDVGLYEITIPTWIAAWGENIFQSLSQLTQNTIGDGVATTSLSLFRSLPAFVMWVVLFIISTFFFIKDKHIIKSAISEALPPEFAAWLSHIRSGLVSALTGYVRAQAFIMSIISGISIAALLFRGYPYALFMGVLIAFLDALPIVGSSLILVPWSALSFLSGDTYSGFYFIALWGINFLTRQLIEPKVLSSQIGLHPIITLLSIYVGLRLLGPMGMLAGPVWVMTLKVGIETKKHNLRT